MGSRVAWLCLTENWWSCFCLREEDKISPEGHQVFLLSFEVIQITILPFYLYSDWITWDTIFVCPHQKFLFKKVLIVDSFFRSLGLVSGSVGEAHEFNDESNKSDSDAKRRALVHCIYSILWNSRFEIHWKPLCVIMLSIGQCDQIYPERQVPNHSLIHNVCS